MLGHVINTRVCDWLALNIMTTYFHVKGQNLITRFCIKANFKEGIPCCYVRRQDIDIIMQSKLPQRIC